MGSACSRVHRRRPGYENRNPTMKIASLQNLYCIVDDRRHGWLLFLGRHEPSPEEHRRWRCIGRRRRRRDHQWRHPRYGGRSGDRRRHRRSGRQALSAASHAKRPAVPGVFLCVARRRAGRANAASVFALRHFDLHFQHFQRVLAFQVHLDVVGIDLHVFRDDGDQFLLQLRQVVGRVAAAPLVGQDDCNRSLATEAEVFFDRSRNDRKDIAYLPPNRRVSGKPGFS